jgi:hypothetical protein
MKISGRIIGLVLMLMTASSAKAISRVGSCAIGDPTDGFTAQIPIQLADIIPDAQDSVIAQGFNLPMGNPIGNPDPLVQVPIQPFHIVYPQLVGLSKIALIDQLETDGGNWTLEDSPDPCILVMTSTSQNTRTTLATWGDGKGMVLTSPLESNVDVYVQNIVSSTVLVSGACAW